MFAYDRRPRSSAADSPPPQRRTTTATVNPTWQKLATSIPAVQRKPTVSTPGDVHEREADAVADRVMRDVEPGALGSASRGIQRMCATCEEEDAKVQTKRSSSGGVAPDGAAGAVRAASHGGEPLPGALRYYFEPRFGHDLSPVRVHADRGAADAAAGISAQAFTVGEHVVFGEGRYSPETHSGQRLIAHELTHVLQQRSGQVESAQRQLDDDEMKKKPEEEMPGGVVQRKEAEQTETVGTSLWAKDPDGKNLPPSLEDISQGGLNDCFLFAAMAAIVNTNPQKIVDMIKDNGNGTYTVTFKGIGTFSAATQTVTADFVKGKHGNVKGRGAFWPLIIEKAYAKQKGGFSAFDEGGFSGKAVDEMTDVSQSTFDPREKTNDYIMGKLVKAKEKKWPVTMGTPKREDASKEKKAIADSGTDLRFWHAYVCIDVDAEKNRVKLFNPWGNHHPGTAGDGWVDVDTIRKFFKQIRINAD